MWLEAKVLMLRASLNDFHASGEITLAAKAANLLAYYQGMLELNTRQGLIMARIRRETDEFLAMLASDRVLGST